MSANQIELQVTNVAPVDLFEYARLHGSRRSLLGSILKDDIPFQTITNQNNTNRPIFVLRHGERVDYIFPDFISECFDPHGNLIRRDLNIPKTLPNREPFEIWEKDAPLTNIGLFQAEQIGEGVKLSGQCFDTVICSPAYRCVQSCDAFLRGMGLRDKLKIRIDPAVHEWNGWTILHGWDKLGSYFTPQELNEIGFNIDLHYEPIMTSLELAEISETFEESFKRCEAVIDKVLSDPNCKNILIVAHGSNLYSCTDKYIKGPSKTREEMFDIFAKVPYCGFVGIEERFDKTKWDYITPPLATITYSGNYRQSSGMPDKMKENVRKNAKLIYGK